MRCFVLLIVILSSGSLVFAQTDRATVTGVVMDPNQSAVPDAKVILHSIATGTERSVQTNGAGVYTFSALPVGQYELSITAKGFQELRIQNFTLEVGQTRTLNVNLRVAAVSTEVTVVGATPDLNLTSAEVGGVIQGSQIQALPVNGRYWASLESLAPGAISSGTGTQDNIRFSGLSQEDNNFRLDGVDATGLNHQFVKTPMRAEFPMESLAEFKASSAVYSADIGSMAGGQISMVTKSGGNAFHGTLYEYLRNSFFDATAWGLNQTLSPFKMNQFGASLGGPIIHNKLFFFINYEGVRQSFDSQIQATVPSQALRDQVMAKSPGLAFVLNAYPTGSIPQSDPNTMLWTALRSAPQIENAGVARVDYALSAKTNITARFNDDNYLDSSSALAEDTITTTKTPNAMLSVQHTFSPTMLNVAKVGFNRDDYSDFGSNVKLPYTVNINGLTSLSLGDHSIRIDNSFSFVDDFTYNHGRHTIKAGTEIRHMQEHNEHPFLEESLSYTSVNNFINNALDSYTNQPGKPANLPRKTPIIAYGLDEFKIRPNLTLNAGLQYEFYSSGISKSAGAVVFDPFTCGLQYCPDGSPGYIANKLDFMPRVSIAWSPKASNGKTVIRVGYGTFFDDSQPNGGPPSLPGNGNFTLSASNIKNLTFPITPFLGSATAVPVSYSGRNRLRKDVRVDEWTLSVEQAVAKETTLQVTYLGAKGTHLLSGTTLNGIDPVTGVRPYASLTNQTISYSDHQGNMTLEALQVGLRRNISTGLLVVANYQWSHEITDGSTGDAENDTWQNVLCRTCERGDADFDVRHNFTASSVWNVPVGTGHHMLGASSPILNALLGGWQMSGIVMARTGLPMNITYSRSSSPSVSPYGISSGLRPNLVPGQPLYLSGNAPTGGLLWLNPAAFSAPANGAWGDLPRNAVRSPGIWQIDYSMEKRFPLSERMAIKFRGDIFNLLNRAQIGKPNVKWTGPTNTNFGIITAPYTTAAVGTGTPRQMQFSLRLEF
ncbi:MAG: TonB-dependent receptor [Chloracidobacterium sp.]|nr:TonB-dependent receptor [Chloracidobacterium sp.]